MPHRPPMGWNSWNFFGPGVSDRVLRETADALVATGLRDLGYRYLVVDDHWHGGRNDDGALFAHPERFPAGIAPLADYCHERGLLFGIYSCAGNRTCGREPGSFGFEERDAASFASWGVDFLKYDFCFVPPDRDEAFRRYRAMGDALRRCGREILFSAAEWGACQGYVWARDTGARMWRTTLDLVDYWDEPRIHTNRGNSILTILDLQDGLERYQSPEGFNDPDMLVVGLQGKGHLGLALSRRPLKPGCTDREYRSHMSLWCLLAAPLMLGCDVRDLSPATLETLSNRELLAIDQDPLCLPCRRIRQGPIFSVYRKPLADGSVAVGILNRSPWRAVFEAQPGTLLHPEEPGSAGPAGPAGPVRIRDVWAHADLALPADPSVPVRWTVESHETRVMILGEVRA